MSESTAHLQHQIEQGGELRSVVRTMKALAAASIGQYERSVVALSDYYQTIEIGLGACFRALERSSAISVSSGSVSSGWVHPSSSPVPVGAVVFGSDQGLVGQFNEMVADEAMNALRSLPQAPTVWAVGERVRARLVDGGLMVVTCFPLPNSVERIAPLVGQILVETETHGREREDVELQLFYNRPTSGASYTPVRQRLLPLDQKWRREIADCPWPKGHLPEVMGGGTVTVRALIREYVFISLFRACAESLASENASRLAAMQRADKNIDELLTHLQKTFHRLRQSGIDEELFDVISGFEALTSR